jgi:hypothetical protein
MSATGSVSRHAEDAIDVAIGGKADMAIVREMSAFDPKRTFRSPSSSPVFIDTMPCR